jgi:hypothetical protein
MRDEADLAASVANDRFSIAALAAKRTFVGKQTFAAVWVDAGNGNKSTI